MIKSKNMVQQSKTQKNNSKMLDVSLYTLFSIIFMLLTIFNGPTARINNDFPKIKIFFILVALLTAFGASKKMASKNAEYPIVLFIIQLIFCIVAFLLNPNLFVVFGNIIIYINVAISFLMLAINWALFLEKDSAK